MDFGLRTPLLDQFRRGEVARDVRLLAATRCDLRELVRAGRFREDLYYRLKVFEIVVPPLCERRADLPALVQHFYKQLSGNPSGELRMTPRAWGALTAYRFPGNVRELRNLVKFACAFSAGETVDLVHLPPEVAGDIDEDQVQVAPGTGGPDDVGEVEVDPKDINLPGF